jgi:hypothetical protein
MCHRNSFYENERKELIKIFFAANFIVTFRHTWNQQRANETFSYLLHFFFQEAAAAQKNMCM